MEKIINKWSDVTLTQYLQIIDIANEEGDEIEKDVKIISVLYGLDEKSIWDMEVEEVNKIRTSLAFISTPPKGDKNKYTTLKLGDQKYNVCTDLNKFSYAQYVDFQTYYKKENNIVEVLSTIIVPDGYKYGEYDIEAVRKKIKTLDVQTAVGICTFFFNCLMELVRSTLKYLEGKMKIMKTLTKGEKKKELQKIETQMKAMKAIIG